MLSFGLGCRPDAHDPRDRLFSARLARLGTLSPLPLIATIRDDRVGPKNQLRSSSCVGQSTSQAQRLSYLKRGVDCPDLSALYVYRLARNEEGILEDAGAQIRLAMQAIQAEGVAPESTWPFSMARVNTPVPFSVTRKARALFGVRSYYRIAVGDFDGIKRALANGFGVTAGFPVTLAFEQWNGIDLIGAQTGTIEGYHALPITSFDASSATTAWEFLNSWGNWGRGGYGVANDDFIRQASDIWAHDIEEAA